MKEPFSIRDGPAPEHTISNSEPLGEIAQCGLFLSFSNHDQVCVRTLELSEGFDRDVESFLE